MPSLRIFLGDTFENLSFLYGKENEWPWVISVVSGRGDFRAFFVVNDEKHRVEEDKSSGMAFCGITNLEPGNYVISVTCPFQNGFEVKNNIMVQSGEPAVLKFKLDDIDMDDPLLQANTLRMDVLAEAPYCIRRHPEDGFPLLPIIVFAKDIKNGIIIKKIEIAALAGGIETSINHLVRNGVDDKGNPFDLGSLPYDVDCEPDFPSGLGDDVPWWALFYLSVDDLQNFIQRDKPLEESKYLPCDCIEFIVTIRYQSKRWFLSQGSTTRLRVMLLDPLPAFENWYYGDTHYHSIYTDNPAEYGGPAELTAKVASCVGLHWFFLTDHSWDFTRTEWAHGIRGEERWRRFLNWIPRLETGGVLLVPAEEITVRLILAGSDTGEGDEPKGIALHLLAFETGPGGLVKDDLFLGRYTLEEILDKFTRMKEVNASFKPLLFPAHPGSSSYFWAKSDLEKISDSEFFSGLQVFNERVSCSASHTGADVRRFDLFSLRVEEKDPYEELGINMEESKHNAIGSWIWLLLKSLRKYERDPIQALRKPFIVGGSDAHMDFNFALRPEPLLVHLKFTDNAFGKVRTLALMESYKDDEGDYERQKAALISALSGGRCVVTDGPVVIPALEIADNSGEHISTLQCGDLGELSDGQSAVLKYDYKIPRENRGSEILLRCCLPTPDAGREACLVQNLTDDEGQAVLDLASHIDESKSEGRKLTYVRLELICRNHHKDVGRCYTNPIWLRMEP